MNVLKLLRDLDRHNMSLSYMSFLDSPSLCWHLDLPVLLYSLTLLHSRQASM